MMRSFRFFRTRKSSLLLTIVTGLSIILSACSGQVTIGRMTFGVQRTPQPVVVVKNDAPASRSTGSENWSGYAITRSSEHDVIGITATWQVPQVSGSGNADSSTWAGIGGIYSQSLVQAGTDQQLVNGQPVYYAWYELLPDKPKLIDTVTILPGDIVTVSIMHVKDMQWNVTVMDQNTNQTVQQHITYSSCYCSAEWVEELPSVRGGDPILANFASVTFTHISAMTQGAKQLSVNENARPIKMVTKAGHLLAVPQVLQGDSFSIVYVADQ